VTRRSFNLFAACACFGGGLLTDTRSRQSRHRPSRLERFCYLMNNRS
jgi:hypothetical protein